MTDTPELNVWRESCRCYEDGAARDLALPMRDMVVAGDQSAAAVIRSYGDQRDAEGYAQAVADVVAWLGEDAPQWGHEDLAHEITRRFGKGQDHG